MRTQSARARAAPTDGWQVGVFAAAFALEAVNRTVLAVAAHLPSRRKLFRLRSNGLVVHFQLTRRERRARPEAGHRTAVADVTVWLLAEASTRQCPPDANPPTPPHPRGVYN